MKPRSKSFSPIMNSNMRNREIDRSLEEARDSSSREIAVKVKEKRLINDVRRSAKAFERMNTGQVAINQKGIRWSDRQFERMVTFFRAAFEMDIGIIAMPREGSTPTDRTFGVRRFRVFRRVLRSGKLMLTLATKVLLFSAFVVPILVKGRRETARA